MESQQDIAEQYKPVRGFFIYRRLLQAGNIHREEGKIQIRKKIKNFRSQVPKTD